MKQQQATWARGIGSVPFDEALATMGWCLVGEIRGRHCYTGKWQMGDRELIAVSFEDAGLIEIDGRVWHWGCGGPMVGRSVLMQALGEFDA